uniref:Seipin n=1 Tax=Kalanchoe fedtschenkoi TaxID=63787 RepID=A0A7N0ZRN8_KALFE
MGGLKDSDAEDCFVDAFEEFPFYDCADSDTDESTPDSTISHAGVDGLTPQLVQKGACFDAPEASGSTSVHNKSTVRRRRASLHSHQDEIESAVEDEDRNSSVNLQSEEINPNAENLRRNAFVKFAGLVFRSVWYSFKLLVNISSSPIWTLYHIYAFLTDPFSIKKRIRNYVIGKVWSLWYPVSRTVVHYVYDWWKEQKVIWKLARQLGWGVLWAIYLCLVMCALLVFAAVASGKVVNHVAERPVVIKESLNFDYTKESPVSFVPVGECCGGGCEKSGGLRMIPQGRKVQVGVTLTLPESDYNRVLGMFQVQFEALSANGETLAAMSRPCTVQYKSVPLRLVLTLLEMVPLVTGYRLESQTRHVKMGTFTEGASPTACFKVTMDGRAEFPSGAGVPEVYSASLTIESRHIFLRQFLWYLKPLVFLWIGFMFFTMELFFVLLFCRSIVLPKVASRDHRLVPQDDQPASPS